MPENTQKRWKRQCIYCSAPVAKNKEHVFPKHVGYVWPMRITCALCNNQLGALVDSCWPDDYWIALRQGRASPDAQKSDRFVVVTDGSGNTDLVEPFTSAGAWRAVAKIAFECLSFAVKDKIFDAALDEWRNFIRRGSPDLVGERMHRVRYHPGLWGDHHEITIAPKTPERSGSCMYVVLFGVYEFMCDLNMPYPADLPHYQIGVDPDDKMLHMRTASGYDDTWAHVKSMRIG